MQEPAPPLTPKEDSLLERLVAHVKASLRPEANRYDLPLSVLLRSTGRGSGKSTLARWTAARAGMHLLEVRVFPCELEVVMGLTLHRSIASTSWANRTSRRKDICELASTRPLLARPASSFSLTSKLSLARRRLSSPDRVRLPLPRGPNLFTLRTEPAMASILQDCLAGLQAAWKSSNFPVVVIGTTSVPDRIPASVLACFKTEFVIEAPGEAERLEILRSLLRYDHMAPDVALKSIAVQTAALVANDLVDLVSRTRARALQRAQDAACVAPFSL